MSENKPDKPTEEDAPEKKLAFRLRMIAEAVEKGSLDNDTGPFSESLVESLEALLADECLGVAVVMIGEELTVDDWMASPGTPPPAMFELAGRLQGIANRLTMLASHAETHGDLDEDHTGHGCPHDPEVKAKNAN